MKKFLFLLLTVVLLISCTTMSTKQLVRTVRNSIGSDIDDIGQTLINHGFVESSRRYAEKIIFEHGDTMVYIIPSMADQRMVGGAYICITTATAEKGLEQYHKFRELCRNDYPFYGAKIINIFGKTQEEALYSSTDPITIDTLSAAEIESRGITINERWEDGDDFNNRTVVAMFKNQFGTYNVTAVFRTSNAIPEGF